MGKQASTFEWQILDEPAMSDQAWEQMLPMGDEREAARPYRSGLLLRLAACVIVLLWLQSGPRANQNNLVTDQTDSEAYAASGGKTSRETLPIAYRLNGPVGNLLATARQQGTLKANWQPLLAGLQHYFWLQQQPRSAWDVASDPAIPWTKLTTLPLYALFPDDLKYRRQYDATADRINLIATRTLAEYLITTYGQEILPTLLAGFRRYDTWEELSPAVFGLPARQLEAGWQNYMVANTIR